MIPNTAALPETLSIEDGRARLEAADWRRMDDFNDPRFEIWLDAKANQQIVWYVGTPPSVRYLKRDIDDIVSVN